jgi:hypothetical protein
MWRTVTVATEGAGIPHWGSRGGECVYVDAPDVAAELVRVSPTTGIAVAGGCLFIPRGEGVAAETLGPVFEAEVGVCGTQTCAELRCY